MRKNILVTSLGVKAVALSVGSMALSLGLNLVDLDNNQAQADAGLSNVGNGSIQLLSVAEPEVYTGTANTYSTAGWGGVNPIVYASEIFGSNSASTVLPEGVYAAAKYQIDGQITVTFNAKFTLDNGAVFDGDPVACLDYDTATTCTNLTILDGSGSTAGGGSGKNYVTYQINASLNPITSATTDNIILAYKIKSANALATSGSKVQMTATLRTPEPGYDVNPSSTVTIAESKQGVKVELTPDTGSDADDDRITVASGGLEFAFTRATNQAKIGNLKITNTCGASAACVTNGATLAHTTNGITAWQLGGSTGVSVDSTKSNFTITGGQFAASITSPGKVELADTSTSYVSQASTQATDAETAVFKLDNTNLGSLTQLTKGADVYIVADNKTPVNLVENSPIGQVTITYATTSYQATTFPSVELKRIKQDGMRCTVYNVPAPGSADIVAVRITNDSGVDGIVNATLYDGAGTEIFASQPLNSGNAIKAGATLAVFADDLAKLGTWTGRGVLVLTTELPSMEVLGLLREAGNNSAPLTNLSTGATGVSCTN